MTAKTLEGDAETVYHAACEQDSKHEQSANCFTHSVFRLNVASVVFHQHDFV